MEMSGSVNIIYPTFFNTYVFDLQKIAQVVLSVDLTLSVFLQRIQQMHGKDLQKT